MQIGPTEILMVALLALLLFAPRKLPELARALREAADIIRGGDQGEADKNREKG
ncbi:MAG: twin-arginine translocase TatA/TatE family subunit [Thermofilum sp.]|uniref:Twin-arginine translocase TatA/TatE family subunit n=1 Tax=Thermofilum pendens TaxID=2269 RepID=A0A7C4D227_THEPE